MTTSADRHRDAVQDGHVLLMFVRALSANQVARAWISRLRRLPLLVLFQLLGGKGGETELGGQVSVGLPNKDER